MKSTLMCGMAALLAASLASCGTDDPAKNHLKVAFANQFSFMTTAASDTVVSALDGTINFTFDDVNRLADITIDGMTMSDGSTRSLVIGKVPFTADSHSLRRGDVAGLTDGEVSGLKFAYFPDINAEGSAEAHVGLYLSLTFADGSRATFFPYTCRGFGATETTNTSAGDSKFVSTKTSYTIELRPESHTATLVISNAAFAEGMPALGDMELRSSQENGETDDLHLSLSHEGYRLEAPMIIPSIAGVPYLRYSITALGAEAELDKNRLDLGFNCMRVFRVNAVTTAVDMPMLELK